MRLKFLMFLWLFGTCVALAQQTPAPVLFTSDLDSGPATGNSDSTYSSNGGVYVTLYGNYLDSFTSVKLNGASCLTVVSNPATWMWYERMVVQLSSGCSTGNFTVTTSAGTSNGLPFTVRAGNIYYVSKSGSDSASGSFNSPWASMPNAIQTMAAEGITYVENGVTQPNTDNQGWGALTFRNSWCGAGPNGFPRALIAYPGATATVGSNSYSGNAFYPVDYSATGGACVGYWTWGELTIRAQATALSLNGPQNGSGVTSGNGSNHWRVVGNDVSCPGGQGQTACMHTAYFGTSSGAIQSFIQANNFHIDNTSISPDDQYHGIYLGDNTRWVDVGWNTVSNVSGCRGIQLYSNYQDEWGITVHDNTIHDTSCDGIVIANVDPSKGAVSAYNNVLYNVGKGPQNTSEGGGSWNCIYHDRHVQPAGSSGSGTINVYNNSCYKWGNVQNSTYESCDNTEAGISIANDDDSTVENIQNNILYSAGSNKECSSGYPYWMNSTGTSGAMSGTNNLMYGAGAPPSGSVTNTVNSNPSIVSTTTPDLHLSASSSPANGAGSSANKVPTYDHDGRVRPSPPSIGAYEYASGTTTVAPPAPPTNLQAVVN
jgi:hypothetical protein